MGKVMVHKPFPYAPYIRTSQLSNFIQRIRQQHHGPPHLYLHSSLNRPPPPHPPSSVHPIAVTFVPPPPSTPFPTAVTSVLVLCLPLIHFSPSSPFSLDTISLRRKDHSPVFSQPTLTRWPWIRGVLTSHRPRPWRIRICFR